jgi:hypothetical protein
MKTSLQYCCLALVFTALPGVAGTIQFSGIITDSTGVFLTTGTTGQGMTGSVQFLTAGPDQDPSPNLALYTLSSGLIQLNFAGVAQPVINAATTTTFVTVEDVAEGIDRITIISTLAGTYGLLLTLNGTENMLSSSAFPALAGAINWAHFTGGTGELTFTPGNLLPTAGPDDDVLLFDITNASDVPEPSTFVLAGCALAFMAWRRRS